METRLYTIVFRGKYLLKKLTLAAFNQHEYCYLLALLLVALLFRNKSFCILNKLPLCCQNHSQARFQYTVLTLPAEEAEAESSLLLTKSEQIRTYQEENKNLGQLVRAAVAWSACTVSQRGTISCKYLRPF